MNINNPSTNENIKERNGKIIQPELDTIDNFDASKIQTSGLLWKNNNADEYHAPPLLLSTDGLPFAFYITDVTNWNCDTTDEKAVAHGVTDFTNIIFVQFSIRPDTVFAWYEFMNDKGSNTRITWNSTNILLHRETGGSWDGPSYSGTGQRGRLTVCYYL